MHDWHWRPRPTNSKLSSFKNANALRAKSSGNTIAPEWIGKKRPSYWNAFSKRPSIRPARSATGPPTAKRKTTSSVITKVDYNFCAHSSVIRAPRFESRRGGTGEIPARAYHFRRRGATAARDVANVEVRVQFSAPAPDPVAQIR